MALKLNNPEGREGPLAGWKLLTTRPEPLASRLLEPLQAAGAEAWNLPLLELEPLELGPQQRQWLLDLDLFHKVVVISPSAASFLLEQLEDYWPQWPVGLDWFTVGAGSALTLESAGIPAHYPTTGDTSEDLLLLPELQALEGQKVLLVKGQGGRTLLQETLVSRGATVSVLELYTRIKPRLKLNQLDELARGPQQVLILSSGAALEHYIELTGGGNKTLCLVVPSERLRRQALAQGFTWVINSEGAGADAIIKALTASLPKSLD